MSDAAALQSDVDLPEFDISSFSYGIDQLHRFELELADVESALVDIETATT